MTHSNLKVEVQGSHIVVVLRGTCFRAKYRKQDAPWLATDEYGPDDPDAPMSLSEFRNEAWAAANDAARQLGWIKSCDELHKAAKPAETLMVPILDRIPLRPDAQRRTRELTM